MQFLIYFADIFSIEISWNGSRCIRTAFSSPQRSVELTGNNAHHSFVECNSNSPCSSLFLEEDKKRERKRARERGGQIYYPSTYLCTDRSRSSHGVFFHTIHVCVSIRSCGRAYFTCPYVRTHRPLLLPLCCLVPLNRLPLCGGSHLALFKEILMALDGILRPNFAARNFAESGNSSHRALSSPSQFSLCWVY